MRDMQERIAHITGQATANALVECLAAIKLMPEWYQKAWVAGFEAAMDRREEAEAQHV